jgi:glyoxylase-like metal-dependent hydrolase (beta-lactamase superfamily II)
VSSNEGRHVFTGDAAGMRLPNTRFPTLPMVPPEFNLEQWLNSIRTIQSLEVDSMWMTHFDEIDDHFDYLEKAYQRVVEEARFICSLPNTDDDEAISDYQAWQITMAENEGIQPSLVKRYCDRTHYTANLTGVRRWLSKGGQLP